MSDPNRDLAYIPETFLSRKQAFRTFKLTENVRFNDNITNNLFW